MPKIWCLSGVPLQRYGAAPIVPEPIKIQEPKPYIPPPPPPAVAEAPVQKKATLSKSSQTDGEPDSVPTTPQKIAPKPEQKPVPDTPREPTPQIPSPHSTPEPCSPVSIPGPTPEPVKQPTPSPAASPEPEPEPKQKHVSTSMTPSPRSATSGKASRHEKTPPASARWQFWINSRRFCECQSVWT